MKLDSATDASGIEDNLLVKLPAMDIKLDTKCFVKPTRSNRLIHTHTHINIYNVFELLMLCIS